MHNFIYIFFALFLILTPSVSAHYDPNMPEHTHESEQDPPGEKQKIMQKQEDRPDMRPEVRTKEKEVRKEVRTMEKEMRKEDRPASKEGIVQKREDRRTAITGMVEKKEQRMETRQKIVKEKLTDRCQRIASQSAVSMERYENNHRGYVERYTHMLERLDKAAVALSEKGYDTAALDESIDELLSKIEKMNEDHAAFIASLSNVPMDCTDRESSPSAAFRESRQLLEIVRKDALDIRTYYQTVVRKELLALKEQVREKDSTTSAEVTPVQ